MNEDKKSPKVSISSEAKKQMPKVSIIFTNYNGGQNPINCLNSIKKLDYPQSLVEAIVVDNHSTDGSLIAIEKNFPSVKILKQKKNLGFAKAINLGIKKAKGEYIFITNDDVTFEKNSLKTLISYALKHKNCILGGKQLNPQTKKFIAGGRRFSLLTGLQSTMEKASSPTICDQIDGCAMLISKKLITNLGLFDEGFYPVYGEDLDLCLRAKKVKIKVIYHPKAILFHNPSQTVSKLPLHDIYYYGFKNRLRVLIKHANPLQLGTFLMFHYFLVMPFRIIVRKEPIVPAEIRAFVWNFKNLSKTLEAGR